MNGVCSIELLCEHQPDELMREDHSPKGNDDVSALL